MIQAETPALILASASAARRDLLQAAGVRFTVQQPDVDEGAIKRRMAGGPPGAIALALADAKAASVPASGAIVIGADQILVCEGRCFDKPRGLADAAAHLRALRGRQHELITAISCWRDGRQLWHHTAIPVLTMREISDGFIDAYLRLEGPACFAAVGAYRVEALGIHLFSHVSGEHSAILGLPLLPLLRFLRSEGLLLA